MLFRSCATRYLHARDVNAAVGDFHNAIDQRDCLFPRVGVSELSSPFECATMPFSKKMSLQK
jgi:hypothetical protein